jgi:3-dehydroquinate synthase
VVTDARVARHHGPAVLKVLRRSGCPVSLSVVPAGERSKSAARLALLWREMALAGCDRSSCIVALGGGVVGDLAGFAAASILRGVDLVQVPTTLLAMVDSSVGGKTGINLPEGKNLAGAFHQPRAVVADLDFLRTLPGRELRSGWAEVVKTAAIRDLALWRRLEREGHALRAGSPAPLARVIARVAAIKAEVVGADERETGLRRILNFGHTLGHAIEAVHGYGRLLHGEAVSIGMVFAAELGEALGHTPAGTAARLAALLLAYGLPVRPAAPLSPARLLAAMARDKKRGPSGLRWVLLRRLGEAVVIDRVPESAVRHGLGRFLAGSTSRKRRKTSTSTSREREEGEHEHE